MPPKPTKLSDAEVAAFRRTMDVYANDPDRYVAEVSRVEALVKHQDRWGANSDVKSMLGVVSRHKSSLRPLRLFSLACYCRLLDRSMAGCEKWIKEQVEFIDEMDDSEYVFESSDCSPVLGLAYVGPRIRSCIRMDVVHTRVASPVIDMRRWRLGFTSLAGDWYDGRRVVEATRVTAALCYLAHVDEETARGYWRDDAPISGMMCYSRYQSALLRDIFGEHYGGPDPAPVFDPSLLLWHGGAIKGMAESLYAKGDFHDMPVLADMLDDAGADPRMGAHARRHGPHVHGCWVLDLILNRGMESYFCDQQNNEDEDEDEDEEEAR